MSSSAARAKEWRARRTPEKKAKDDATQRIRSVAYRLAHPDRVKAARQKHYYGRARFRDPAVRRRKRYGLSPAQFGTMLGKQEGLCAICATLLTSGQGTHIDHDHATGKVRGLLCSDCNNGIARLKDSPALCVAANSYLTFHTARSA